MKTQSDLENLINKLSDNRDNLEEMLITLSSLRKKSEDLFTNDKDFRNRYLLDSKLKVMSELFKNELAVRKEINDSIKMEFDLSTKVMANDSSGIKIGIDEIDGLVEQLEDRERRIQA